MDKRNVGDTGKIIWSAKIHKPDNNIIHTAVRIKKRVSIQRFLNTDKLPTGMHPFSLALQCNTRLSITKTGKTQPTCEDNTARKHKTTGKRKLG